jgi:hypothetical protein
MANYYTYVSFIIPLTPEQQDWAIDELYRESDADPSPGVRCGESDTSSAIGHDLIETPEGFQVAKMEGQYLWISHDESANVDALCTRLQNIMKHFNIPGTWGFGWSNDCSKPRTHAYGGGACSITQTQIEMMCIGQWLADHGVRAE